MATKKKLNAAGEVDGQMNPWLRASLMYSSMAVLSVIWPQAAGLLCRPMAGVVGGE